MRSITSVDLAVADLLSIMDPGYIMRRAGLIPDDWQQTVCNLTAARILLLVCRQVGKSSCGAAMGLRLMLRWPETPVMIFSPRQDQSDELLRKCRLYMNNLNTNIRMIGDATTKIELSNGSRMLSKCGKPESSRSWGNSKLIILDEASRLDYELYETVVPMLAPDGQLMMMSTPAGKRGMFHTAWEVESDWYKLKIIAEQVPRRWPPSALAAIRADPMMTERMYRQEFECSFEDTIDQAFSTADIDAAVCDDVKPLYEIPA